MKKIYRILGKKGRITIPHAIRAKLKLKEDDLLSFKETNDGAVVICKEKICDSCKASQEQMRKKEKLNEEITLYEFLNGLSPDQQRAALVHLSVKWAAMQGGN